MGLPLWREPEERESDNSFDPGVARRSAIRRSVRQSRTAAAASRPRVRSSQTLFDLLCNDYAQDSLNTLSSSSSSSTTAGSVPSRERREYWSDMNALPTPAPDSERPALRVMLPEIEPSRVVRNYRPIIRLRSEGSRVSSPSALAGETFTSRFPPAYLPSRYMDSSEGRRYRSSLPAPTPTTTSAASASASTSTSSNGEGSSSSRRSESILDRVRLQRMARYNEATGEEPELPTSAYVRNTTTRNWFDVDGLGDRERSLSPDATLPWEAVAHDLGLQSCDFYESDSEGEVAALGSDMLWELPYPEDHFRIRRLTSFLSARNRDLDRLAERL
ncbi:hypothetical protein RUND412_009129 [Rhizina undulata]